MAKPTVPDDTKLKDGLLKAMSGEVVKTTGTPAAPGIFGTGKTAEALFQSARDLGYVEPCDGPPAKGKTQPTYGRITEKGRLWLLEKASPREVLEGLLKAFEKQSASLVQESSEMSFLQSQLAELQHSYELLQRSIQEGTARRREEVTRLQDNFHAVTQTVSGAVLELDRIVARAIPSTSGEDLGPETETFVRQWRNQRSAGCPLHELFKHLKERSSRLTIGGFHDLLRALYDACRIRLTGWHDSPDRMPDPNLALFVSSKVMYHADVPDSSL